MSEHSILCLKEGNSISCPVCYAATWRQRIFREIISRFDGMSYDEKVSFLLDSLKRIPDMDLIDLIQSHSKVFVGRNGRL